MNLKRSIALSHIGWAVKDCTAAAEAFKPLGFEPVCGEVEDEERGVRILLLGSAGGGSLVELVAPLRGSSPVSNTLVKNGPSAYHCCFDIAEEDLEARISELRKVGFMPITAASPAPALGGDEVIFLYSGDIGLIELRVIKRTS